MTDLTNKIALVTGGSRGIGAAIARRLARDGARVVVHYSASPDAADAVVDAIRQGGGQADAVAADLAAADGPWKLVEAVKGLGVDRLDILAANAGVATMKTLFEQDVADFDRQYAVNVRAPFFLLQQAAPLIPDGGSVIITSSVVARIGMPMAVAYAGTKGAVDTLIKSFALEFGGRGIRVNGIAPGVIDTDMSPFKTEEEQQFVLGLQALKRIGQPEDIADVVAFLASDDSRWITGRTVEASGGANL